jgi:RNA polymerase sigma-70 factor (ECF subfamily)
MSATGEPELTAHLFRRQAGHIVASLARTFGSQHLQLIEDSVQDAFIRALQVWPFQGVPENPAGWITQTARHRALDALRRARVFDANGGEPTRAASSPRDAMRPDLDDDLALMFLCCHPSLSQESQIALTLKIACGFSVGEIARALLSQQPSVAQRLVRAKRHIRDEQLRIELPAAREMQERVDPLLRTIYLLFNEGYTATSGSDLVRRELCEEALRLALLVADHPDAGTGAAQALAALLSFQAARLPARTDGAGSLVLLADQDRALWDRRLIAQGLDRMLRSMTGPLTPYHLEAEIASLHFADDMDWPRILTLYDALYELLPTPVIALNRAVALAHVEGPEAAIAVLAPLETDPALRAYHLLPAVLGELWRRAGYPETAAVFFEAAESLARNEPERRFLAANAHPRTTATQRPPGPRTSAVPRLESPDRPCSSDS